MITALGSVVVSRAGPPGRGGESLACFWAKRVLTGFHPIRTPLMVVGFMLVGFPPAGVSLHQKSGCSIDSGIDSGIKALRDTIYPGV